MRLYRVTGKRRTKTVIIGEGAHMGICGSYDKPQPGTHVVNERTGEQHTLMLDFAFSADSLVRHFAQLSKTDCLHLVRKIVAERAHLEITDAELAKCLSVVVKVPADANG